MSQMQHEYPPPAKKGLSTGAKIGIGCAATTVIVVVLICGGVIFAARWGIAKLDEFAEPFEQQGYVRVSQQMVTVTEPITQDTVFTGQIITIRSDVSANLAIMGQMVEIHGTVDGDIDFFGQMLTIKPNSVVTGELRVEAGQTINVQGVVEGGVSGSYQTLQGNAGPPPAGPPPADAPPDDTPAAPAGG